MVWPAERLHDSALEYIMLEEHHKMKELTLIRVLNLWLARNGT